MLFANRIKLVMVTNLCFIHFMFQSQWRLLLRRKGRWGPEVAVRLSKKMMKA